MKTMKSYIRLWATIILGYSPFVSFSYGLVTSLFYVIVGTYLYYRSEPNE